MVINKIKILIMFILLFFILLVIEYRVFYFEIYNFDKKVVNITHSVILDFLNNDLDNPQEKINKKLRIKNGTLTLEEISNLGTGNGRIYEALSSEYTDFISFKKKIDGKEVFVICWYFRDLGKIAIYQFDYNIFFIRKFIILLFLIISNLTVCSFLFFFNRIKLYIVSKFRTRKI